jgi:hypothetical protein
MLGGAAEPPLGRAFKIDAYPRAFSADFPNKGSRPKIDIKGKPEEWLNIIKAIYVTGTREGFKQDEEDNSRFPFMYLPILQKQIFIKYL